ncbi:MAG: alpha/beta fold hydrolase [Burkholderiaceae bacterium]
MPELYPLTLPHGITLSCRAAGQKGQPVMVFLHGFPEGAFVWDGLLEHIAKLGYRCIAPNLRGFEKSSAPADVAQYRPKHLVQDIAALIAIESPGQPLACLAAHDWGGAVAWNLANQLPQLMQRLCIINSPHPGTFLRELRDSPAQQAASAYMNFLIRPDAEALLAQDDYRRLWEFFTKMFADGGPQTWLTDAVKDQYRAVWNHGLTGGCNYYRASPIRPPTASDPGAAAITLPREMLTVTVPTQVIWGMQDVALPPALLDGLDDYVAQLQVHRVADATHWIIHEQPALVAQVLEQFLLQK